MPDDAPVLSPQSTKPEPSEDVLSQSSPSVVAPPLQPAAIKEIQSPSPLEGLASAIMASTPPQSPPVADTVATDTSLQFPAVSVVQKESPKKEKKRSGVPTTLIILLLLVLIPVGIYYTGQQNTQVTEQRSQAAESGVIGEWKLTDTDTVAKDSSNTANNGAYTGTVPATGVCSLATTARQFGGDGYITIPQSSVYAIGSNFSITMWTKFDSGSTGGNLFNKRTNTDTTGFVFFRHSDNKLYFQGGNGAWLGAWNCATPEVLSDTAWHHVGAVQNGSTVALYIDGAKKATCTGASASTLNTVPITVGAGLKGYIQDVRFWNKVLSDSDMSVQHQEYANCAGTPMPTGAAFPEIIANWNMEDTGNVISDVSGQGHNAPTVGTYSVDGVCSSSKAREFNRNGVISAIDVPYQAVLEKPANFSFETWVKFLDTSGVGFTLFNQRDSVNTTNQNYGLSIFRYSDNKIYFQGGNSTWLSAANCSTYTTITDTNWHHFVGVHRGDKIQLYVDGMRTGDCIGAKPIVYTPQHTVIGAVNVAQMRAIVDDTLLWGRELAESEIASRYKDKITCLTPTPTKGPSYCDASCNTDSDCSNGNVCTSVQGVNRCRNASCSSYATCICPTVTATPKTVIVTTTIAPVSVTPIPTQSTPRTPVSGVPSIFGIGTVVGGAFLLFLGILL